MFINRNYNITCTGQQQLTLTCQLIVTTEMVAKKIKAMKDNKSPGVHGIPPKQLMETVEQISIPLIRVLNLSLKYVTFEWKEANVIPLLKKCSGN